MAKKFDVMVFGDLCADFILSSKDITPEFGQKEKLVNNYSLEMGGSCSIFSCQTAKLGLKTAVVGKLGRDAFGEVVINTLKSAGVHTGYIKIDSEEKTGVSTILNTGSDRAILTYTGTIDAAGAEDIPWDLFKDIRHFHLGSFFLMKKLQPFYTDIIKELKKHNVSISVDINWDPEERWADGIHDILPEADIFFCNENEAKAVAAKNTLREAVDVLSSRIPVVVIKKGKEGAEAYYDGKHCFEPSIPGEKADAVGAGDSFDGGFVFGYLNGPGIETALKIGCLCGSYNTRKAGGTKGQPGIEILKEYNLLC